MGEELKYRRILLKLSGEAFCAEGASGLDPERMGQAARELVELQELGVELAVTLGGGNLFRGAQLSSLGIRRATADSVGMLATVMNGLALRDLLESMGAEVRLMSSIPIGSGVCDSWSGSRGRKQLEQGRILLLGAGTGNPFVTTDTGAALRAAELEVDVLLKATKVDGIYSADPNVDESARRYESLTYDEFLRKRLKALDLSAVSMCMDHKIPVVLFDYFRTGNVARVVRGENLGTTIQEGPSL